MMRSPKPTPVHSARSFSKQGFKWVLGLLIIALFVSNALYFAVHMKRGTSTTTLAMLNQAVVEKATASLRLRGKLDKALHAEQISSSDVRPERTLLSPPPRLLAWDNVVSKLAKKEASSRNVEASSAPAVVEATFICMDKDLIGCGKK